MTTRSAHLARTAALLTERSDRELLDLFVRHRDEEAFADVVRRHGPMVLGVCRRVLRDTPDADDAFQAAFLVLARRAGSIASADRLAGWLHGVAFNTARRLRRANARRFRREVPVATLPDAAAPTDPPRDWVDVLDDELTRLPERYRLPVVLCDLEGLTRTEAARALGCPEGTVAGRLARARDLLGRRLAARGVVPGVVVGVSVPASLISASARAAARGVVPPCVAAISDGVIWTMIGKKLGTAAALAFATVAVVTGFGTLPTAAQPPAAKAKANDPTAPLRGFIPAERTLTAFPLRILTPEKAVKELAKHTAAVLVPVPDHRTLLIYADAKTLTEIVTDLAKLGEVRATPTVVQLHKLKADEIAPKLTTLLTDRTGGRPTVVAVPGEQTLLVFASPEKTQRLFAILKELGEDNQPSVAVFSLANANAEEVARTLQEVFNGPRAGHAGVRVTAVPGTKQVVVYASPADMATIRKLLGQFEGPDPGPGVRLIPLNVFLVNFDAVPWADVLDWYARSSGLMFLSAVKPTGTVTLKPGKHKVYTLGEVTDLLNELLIQQKFLLVRREKTFLVVPTDEKIDRSLFRQVSVDELPKLGKSELVEVAFALADYKMTVKDNAADLKKMFGPIADVQMLESKNVVIVRDTAGNVLRFQTNLRKQ